MGLAEKLRHEEKKNFMMENMKRSRIQSALNYKERQKMIAKSQAGNVTAANISNVKN